MLKNERRHLDLALQRVAEESKKALIAMQTHDALIERTTDPAERRRLFTERLTQKLYLDALLQEANRLVNQGYQWQSKALRLKALLQGEKDAIH